MGINKPGPNTEPYFNPHTTLVINDKTGEPIATALLRNADGSPINDEIIEVGDEVVAAEGTVATFLQEEMGDRVYTVLSVRPPQKPDTFEARVANLKINRNRQG